MGQRVHHWEISGVYSCIFFVCVRGFALGVKAQALMRVFCPCRLFLFGNQLVWLHVSTQNDAKECHWTTLCFSSSIFLCLWEWNLSGLKPAGPQAVPQHKSKTSISPEPGLFSGLKILAKNCSSDQRRTHIKVLLKLLIFGVGTRATSFIQMTCHQVCLWKNILGAESRDGGTTRKTQTYKALCEKAFAPTAAKTQEVLPRSFT